MEQCTSRKITKTNSTAAEDTAKIIDLETKVGMIAAQMASLLESLQPGTRLPPPGMPGIDKATSEDDGH